MVDIGREGFLDPFPSSASSATRNSIQILIDRFGIKSLGSVLIPPYYDNIMLNSYDYDKLKVDFVVLTHPNDD